jgi:hypothetical protein
MQPRVGWQIGMLLNRCTTGASKRGNGAQRLAGPFGRFRKMIAVNLMLP